MDPEDFLKRLNDRARSRYGVQMTQSRLEDLIAEYLVPSADRDGPNAWVRDCKSYRRALEVCRIESRAPKGRRLFAREIRIQQWLNGHTFLEHVIREDIRHEFERSGRELFRTLRNALPLNVDKPIREQQLGTMRRNMGEVSPEIVPAGFQYENAELIALLSFISSGHTGVVQAAGKVLSAEEAIAAILGRWGFPNPYDHDIAKFIANGFACILGSPGEFESTAISVLTAASSEQLNVARQLSRAMPEVIENVPAVLSATTPETFASLVGPCKNIAAAIRGQQQWKFLLFIIMLMAVVRGGDEIPGNTGPTIDRGMSQ